MLSSKCSSIHTKDGKKSYSRSIGTCLVTEKQRQLHVTIFECRCTAGVLTRLDRDGSERMVVRQNHAQFQHRFLHVIKRDDFSNGRMYLYLG